MISIPKALPIKFWLDGQETFNEKVEPGIDGRAFLQKWNATDTIRLQFIDTEEKNYEVVVKDSETNEELGRITLTKVAITDAFKYDGAFTFVSLGIVTKKVRLYLVSAENTVQATVNGLLGTISATIINGVVQYNVAIEVGGLIGVVSGNAVFYEFNSATFKVGLISTICSSPDVTLYYTGVYGVGTILWEQPEFITHPSGERLSKELGSIFEYDEITGAVGTDTGIFC